MKKNLILMLLISCLFLMGCSQKAVSGDAADETIITEEQAAEPIYFDDMADINKSSTINPLNSQPTEIILVLRDGMADEKTITKLYNTVKDKVPGWTRIRSVWISGTYDVGKTKNEIDKLVTASGKSRSNLLLLLVGKSLGGAKTYKMMYNYASSFDDFYRTAVVLIDSHEPIAPGKYGRANRWYDYVMFRRNSSSWRKNYDLKWQSRWDSFGSKLAIYNTYQRKHWPQGYSFSAATVNTRVNNKDHFEIVQCPESEANMERAFRFLLR